MAIVGSQLRSFVPSASGIGLSVAVLTAVLAVYFILVCIYRLTFHPLARFPGPFLSRISSWPIVYQAASGDRHLQQLKEHQTYGPIVRIGPNVLSINTIPALKEIYGNRQANLQKSEWYRTIDAPSGPDAFSTHTEINKERHAFKRRVLNHAFSDSALRSSEPFIVDNTRKFCEHMLEGAKLDDGWVEAKNMGDWSTYLGYDIMGDLVFGKSMDTMTSEEYRHIPKTMMSFSIFIYVVAYLPFAALIRPLLSTPLMSWVCGTLAREMMVFIKYAEDQMAFRLAQLKSVEKPVEVTGNTSTRKDFLSYLVDAKDPHSNVGFTHIELTADCGLLIGAGGDPVSSVLSATFFYLIHYPPVWEKVKREIRSTFANEDEIRMGSKLNSCVYLRATIEETLRKAPPNLAHLPRVVLRGGMSIEGVGFLEEGTVLGTSAYAIHHNPEYYPDPSTYIPERWIADPSSTAADDISSPSRVATAKAAFCAFSLGQRGCIGKNLAYLELTLILARVLFVLDMRKPEGVAAEPSGEGREDLEWGRKRRDEYQLRDQFIAGRDGPMVEFSRRVEA